MSAPSLKDPVGRVRIAGMVEGLSYFILLIGSGLKHFAGQPLGVKIFGPIHGALFVLLILLIFQAWGARRLSTANAWLAAVASLLPFGPFLIDRRLANAPEAGAADDPAD